MATQGWVIFQVSVIQLGRLPSRSRISVSDRKSPGAGRRAARLISRAGMPTAFAAATSVCGLSPTKISCSGAQPVAARSDLEKSPRRFAMPDFGRNEPQLDRLKRRQSVHHRVEPPVEVRGNSQAETGLFQSGEGRPDVRETAPRRGAAKMGEQFLKTGLGISHIAQYGFHDRPPAEFFPAFARVPLSSVFGTVADEACPRHRPLKTLREIARPPVRG